MDIEVIWPETVEVDPEDVLPPVVIEGWSIVRHGGADKTTKKLVVKTAISSPETTVDVAGNTLGYVFDEASNVGTGGWVWQGALLMANYLTDKSVYGDNHFAGASVLELGAGIGQVALVLASIGAHVVATDRSLVLPLLQANLENNAHRIPPSDLGGGSAVGAELEWATDIVYNPDLLPPGSEKWDYILAADCLKCKEFVPLLHATLLAYAHPETTIIFSYEERGLQALDVFRDATQQDFAWSDIQGSPIAGNLSSGDRAIWSMTRTAPFP